MTKPASKSAKAGGPRAEYPQAPVPPTEAEAGQFWLSSSPSHVEVGMRAHCLWPETRLLYPGEIGAVSKDGEGYDFVFRFDDGDSIRGNVDMLWQAEELEELGRGDGELLKKDAEVVYSIWCALKGSPARLLNSSPNVTKWLGVVVHSLRPGVRRVVKIDWSNEKLEGMLPSVIGELR